MLETESGPVSLVSPVIWGMPISQACRPHLGDPQIGHVDLGSLTSTPDTEADALWSSVVLFEAKKKLYLLPTDL